MFSLHLSKVEAWGLGLTCCLLASVLYYSIIIKGINLGQKKESTNDSDEEQRLEDAYADTLRRLPSEVESQKKRKTIEGFTFKKERGKSEGTVRFSEVTVCSDDGLDIIEPEDWDSASIWYTREDLDRIKSENCLILCGDLKECTDGLEQTASGYYVRRVVSAVLSEQQRQILNGEDDKEQLSNASVKVSRRSKMSASSRASMLEVEARNFAIEEKRKNKAAALKANDNPFSSKPTKQRRSTFGFARKNITLKRYSRKCTQ